MGAAAILAWIGARAPWLLAGGIALALLLPEAARLLRPALPLLVVLVLGLAMARVDLRALAAGALRPRRLALLLALTLLLMPASAVLYLGIARLAGADPDLTAALVYLGAAPPVSSAANLCFILGLNAPLALEVSVAATLITPGR